MRTLGLQVVIPAPKDDDLNKIDPDTEYVVEIKKKRAHRSLNANSYCWLLCQRIAETMSQDGVYMSKEAVYRRAIRNSQPFEPVCVMTAKADKIARAWQQHGIGWVAVNMGQSKIDGCSVLHLYAGSSTYDTKEMSRLIDCLTDDAAQLGILFEEMEYIDKLVEEWEPKNETE